ncbi:hypothetical protein [Myxococcus sp. RHSTA-1-4]|uniref:hypothetical protein n=1 Tax=Myxococcus sp. RHSTA-1-4 TaxID=2874601 RepID=UPI001CBE5AAC|nr:hypothetical protein [Myxococcus sp. RHSTA-1-4]MBZ4421770.1 hypothetical protein [Myxococcus sp. RHSTA-1-4]
MTDTAGWQRLIAEQGLELLERWEQGGLEPAEAYRLLVLLGRVEQLPVRAPELEALRDRAARANVTPRLAEKVSLPEGSELLEELSQALEAGDGPEALHTILLDVDDLATALDLLGNNARAVELARRAADQVAKATGLAVPLSGWAEGRLATMTSRSAAVALWKQVAGERALLGRHVVFISHSLQPLLRQAASASWTLEPVSGSGFELFESEGRLVLWLEVPAGSPRPQAIELRLRVGAREGAWSYRASHVEKGGIYVDLGAPEELRQRAVQTLGALPAANEPLEVIAWLTSGEGDDPVPST